MKTKSLIFTACTLILSLTLFFTSCKKKNETKEDPKVETPDDQTGTDNRDVQTENDEALNDINDIIGQSGLAGRSSESNGANGITGTICGLTVDSSDIVNGIIKFTYTGVTCLNRTRTGSIKLTLQGNTKWKNAGAIIKVEYLAYKVTRASDQKSFQLDGVQYYTNISGGTWWDLLITKTKTSLVTSVTGMNLQVTFSDAKTATYNINRKISYSYPNNVITVTAEGIGSHNGINNLENYGIARNGDVFTSQVVSSVVWNFTCGGAVLKGQIDLLITNKSSNLNFLYGVDVNGNSVTVGPNQCPYGWKLSWTVNGSSNSTVIAYK